MLVFRDGRTVRTSAAAATRTTRSSAPRDRRACAAARALRALDDFAQETGLICGGQMDVYISRSSPRPAVNRPGAMSASISHRAEVNFRASPTIARNSPTPALPDRRGNHRRRHPVMDRAGAHPTARLRRHRHARPYQRSRSAARARAARSALPGAHRQPREGRADLRRPDRGPDAGRRAETRARPHRPRHRRGHPAGDRRQHRGGAHRREARQDSVPIASVDTSTTCKCEV